MSKSVSRSVSGQALSEYDKNIAALLEDYYMGLFPLYCPEDFVPLDESAARKKAARSARAISGLDGNI